MNAHKKGQERNEPIHLGNRSSQMGQQLLYSLWEFRGREWGENTKSFWTTSLFSKSLGR